ncbi:hypothetical protein SAMN02927913_3080 [Frateuria terrea]|nr:hypothetical protein SAMN02927913_3080 [Frateuria terrea]
MLALFHPIRQASQLSFRNAGISDDATKNRMEPLKVSAYPVEKLFRAQATAQPNDVLPFLLGENSARHCGHNGGDQLIERVSVSQLPVLC